jgi:hypothetical protein
MTFWYPVSGHMRWMGNHLAGCDYCEGKHPIVWAVDRQGKRQAFDFDIPGAGYINVRDVAVGQDGSITAVGLAISGEHRLGNFIATISPDGARQQITQVRPYSPAVVTVVADGTIWTVGAVMMTDRNQQPWLANVLRHYTPSGQLLASTLVQNVKGNSGGVAEVSQASVLMASNDRIGWLTQVCQYIEFSFEAVQLGNYVCPNGYNDTPGISGVALSSANDLLVGGKWLSALTALELDRAGHTWKPVAVLKDSGETQRLLGFDGLTLVTSASSRLPSFMRRYDWYGQPSGPAQ